jgi:hypothetical protein
MKWKKKLLPIELILSSIILMEAQYRFGGCVGLHQQNPHQDPGGRREGEHRHLLPSLPSHPHPLPSHLPLGRSNSYFHFPIPFSLSTILRIQCTIIVLNIFVVFTLVMLCCLVRLFIIFFSILRPTVFFHVEADILFHFSSSFSTLSLV